MKFKKFKYIFFMPCLFLMSCNSRSSSNSNSSNERVITTTFAPLYDFTKRIVGDKYEVICLVGEDEPHDFSLTRPKDVEKAKKSELIISYGNKFDDFVSGLNDEVNFVATEGIEFRYNDNKVLDPHAWLSLLNAKVMVNNIYEKIISIDNENKDFYTNNKDNYLSQLDSLYEEYSIKLKDKANSYLVTSHEAFYYLCKDFSLNQLGIGDIGNNEITPQRINEVVNFVLDNDIHKIYVESLSNSGNVDTIISEIKNKNSSYSISKAELNAYEGVNVSNWEKDDNYLTVMTNNLKEILG